MPLLKMTSIDRQKSTRYSSKVLGGKGWEVQDQSFAAQ